jgi:hypothetical protein
VTVKLVLIGLDGFDELPRRWANDTLKDVRQCLPLHELPDPRRRLAKAGVGEAQTGYHPSWCTLG